MRIRDIDGTMPENIDNVYFDDTLEFTEAFMTEENNDNLSIMHLNARSCANFETFDEIRNLIQSCDCLIDIIIIGETWLKNSETAIYNMDGYNAFHSCREGRAGGGLSVYVDKLHTVCDVSVNANTNNTIMIELRNIKGMRKLFVYGVYRPPGTLNIEEFFRDVERDMQRVRGGGCIMIGDMNIDVANPIGAPLHVRKYIDMVLSYGMKKCNSNITREASHSIIDHICSDMVDNLQHKVVTFRIGISH